MMTLDNLSESEIEQARSKIETFLSRGLTIKGLRAVPVDEVSARTQRHEIGEFDVCFRLVVPQPEDGEILETWGDVTSYIRTQLDEMEHQSSAPDTLLIAEDHPPEHLVNEPLVYYLQSTL